METEIIYDGLSTVPSEYACADGELSAVLNLIPEDGALRPLYPPATVLTLGEGREVVYLHRTTAFAHYIVRGADGSYLWTAEGVSLQGLMGADAGVGVRRVTSVGNTLVLLCDDGMRYFLWKAEEGAYLDLGTQLPELTLSFGLQGEMVRGDEFQVDFAEGIEAKDIYAEFSDVNKGSISSQVLARVNRFIAGEATDKGRFVFPFFVRYAYRLYDGSLTRHSAPILMVCSTYSAPKAIVTGANIGQVVTGTVKYVKARIAAMCHRLDYAVMDAGSLTRLRDWKDIVSGVDIFVSAPVYSYDQSGQCGRFSDVVGDNLDYSVCRHTNSTGTGTRRYQRTSFLTLYRNTYGTDGMSQIELPLHDRKSVDEDIRTRSVFYLLHSVRLEDLKEGRTLVDVPDDYLQSLVNREVMTDDYDSHDRLIPRYAFPYNSRLNVADLSKRLFGGYGSYSMQTYTDGYVADTVLEGRPPATPKRDVTYSIGCRVCIRQDGREVVVDDEVGGMIGERSSLLYIYYPNPNAYKAIVMRVLETVEVREVRLEAHPFLNGACWFGGFAEMGYTPMQDYDLPAVTENPVVELPNKLYVSEVNNPFLFPLSGINTVGTGRILGVSSAVKALSQGQFGQFPLYAFTDEGVWALEVSSTGTYSARQPVTRDVCVSPDSITQIDSAVLFVTARGIMLIQGSETVCLTDALAGEAVVGVGGMPYMDRLAALAGFAVEDFVLRPFAEFLRDCRMVYDYRHQRIVAFNPSVPYAYIYSLRSKAWGMMRVRVEGAVPSYPEAMAMLPGGVLADFSREPEGDALPGLAVTRALKLGAPDVLKTVRCVLQRGLLRKGSVRTALYGSRDLYTWFLVGTSQGHIVRSLCGTPYRYFRIVTLSGMAGDECLSRVSVEFMGRLAGKLR